MCKYCEQLNFSKDLLFVNLTNRLPYAKNKMHTVEIFHVEVKVMRMIILHELFPIDINSAKRTANTRPEKNKA